MILEDLANLLAWYAEHRRDLPWRRTADPYAVMVSEFMLQQTTVAAVRPKYHRWMERFPTLETLACATLDEVFLLWSGLGYYQRARRLHSAAREIRRRGGMPNTYEELLALPGFGPYTAAAVSSICFERPHLAVDTNVVRVLYRYFGVAAPAQDKRGHDTLRRQMEHHLRTADPGTLNQALMELGATLCSVREPSCLLCPLRAGCRARVAQGGPEAYPRPKPRKTPTLTPGVVLLASDGERTLLVRGTALGLLPDLYQPPILFPRQKDSDGPMRAPLDALCEELRKEPFQESWRTSYGISGRKLDLHCLLWRLAPRELKARALALTEAGVPSVLWKGERSNPRVALSSFTRKVLRTVPESHPGAPPSDERIPGFEL